MEPPPSMAVRGETEQAKCVLWCTLQSAAAERIAIGFYAGNAAGRMSMALNSIKFFKSATSMQSVGVVDL